MRLERHVGGLGKARSINYLQARGWRQVDGLWWCQRLLTEGQPLKRALHHQLTEDLCAALGRRGWKVIDYSQRGYARLQDPVKGEDTSLPKALRLQARREGRLAAEFTYALFLAAIL